MSFDLTVVFTGLVGFTENLCVNSKVKMCALLPDADPGRRSIFDNSVMRQHRAFVKFPIDNVSYLSRQHDTLPMEESFGIWYLNRSRLYFEIEEALNAPPGINDF